MPALPDVPGVLRITHHFSIGVDLHALVRWHMTYTGSAPTDAQCATLADAIATHFGTDCFELWPETTTFTGVDVLDLSSPTAGSGTVTAAVVGALSGATLTAGAASGSRRSPG